VNNIDVRAPSLLLGAATTAANLAQTYATNALASETSAAVSAALASANVKTRPAVACATTANITLSGEKTIDTVLTSASRVLVKNQTNATENGVYVSAAGAWARATDADTWTEIQGQSVFTLGGSANIGKTWANTNEAGGTIGSTNITWTEFYVGMLKSIYDPANIAQQLVGTTATQTLTNKTLTSPTANNLTVTGTTVPANGVYLPSSNTVGFAVNTIFRGRLDLTGFCYSAANPGAVPSSSNAGTLIADTVSTSPNLASCGAAVTSVPQWQFINGNGVVGSIVTNASATAFNTSSDKRLKANPQPINDSGAIIDALEPVKFTWKTAAANVGYGVLAQDAYEVFPSAVTKGNDKEPNEDGFSGWSVDYSAFVPILLAELKASRVREASYVKRIESLEAKCQ
jgi:hypothetical protein